MKLVANNNSTELISLDVIVEQAFAKYGVAFLTELDGQLFIYRALTRKEYKDVVEKEGLSDFDKQDILCKKVLIYPENFDFDDCAAGVPNLLFKEIVDNSCLDAESMFYLLSIERDQAEQLGSEMACIIAEAFPSYTIDEIEEWNNFKFIKMYAQAEWVLKNIRGVVFEVDVAEYLAGLANITDEELINLGFKEATPEPQPAIPQEYRQQQQQTNVPPQQPQSTNQKGMSPEQMRAYQDFIRQHPEFADAMQYDAAFTGMDTMTADTVNPALRPGWYHNH